MRIARPSLAISALALTGATTITACTTTTSSTQPTGPGGSFGTIPAHGRGRPAAQRHDHLGGDARLRADVDHADRPLGRVLG
jgi:hypothetical protein